MNSPDHSPRSHSVLSASSASRWMHCVGSVRLTQDLPQADSIYAEEGSGAHMLAEHCLRQNRDARHYVGMAFGALEVTAEVVEHVQVYLDTCTRLRDACDLTFIEHRFSLDKLDPPVPMFGTSDFVGYSTKRRELSCIDLKYGKGVWVSARDNAQLYYYALGASFAIDRPVSKVSMTVVQPRTRGDTVRTTTIDAITLAEWSFELMHRARLTQEPDAPFLAGEWCRFCPARASCATHRIWKAEQAAREFAIADLREADTR